MSAAAWGNDPEGLEPDERLAAGDDIGAEDELDSSLRPRRLDDFIGQDAVKQQLAIFLEAARQRGEALDHVLLAGPPGLGKTSLAGIVAEELGVGFHVTSGPVLERKGDLAAVLTALEPHDVLFIDEIHRLNRAIEEVLYPAMEDYQLDVVLGQGPSARTLRLDLPRFTLVGRHHPHRAADDAAARALRRLPPPQLLRRGRPGGHRAPLRPAARTWRSTPTPPTPWRPARAARRASPTACCAGCATWPRCAAARASTGRWPRRRSRCSRWTSWASRSWTARSCAAWPRPSRAGPVGLGTLADSVGEAADTIEDVYEPYLLQEGLLKRTPRGRVATARAYRHLGLVPPPETGQPGLF